MSIATITAPIVRDIGEQSYDDGLLTTQVQSTIAWGSFEDILLSTLTVQTDTIEKHDHEILMSVTCSPSGFRHVEFAGLPAGIDRDSSQYQYDVEYEFAPEPRDWSRRSGFGTWSAQRDWRSDHSFRRSLGTSAQLYLWLREANGLRIEFTGASAEPIIATFDLEGVSETPIQPNIDQCGDYYSGSPNSTGRRLRTMLRRAE